MKLNLDHIERVARAAQQFARVQFVKWSPSEIGHIDDEPIAEHIATCSPDVVLALVERVRELTLTTQEKEALRWFAENNGSIRETAIALDVIARLTK